MLEGGYAFITAYLKGEEARTLNSGHLAGVTRAGRPQDVTTAIRDTDIGEYLEGIAINTFNDVDSALWEYLGDCFRRLEWFSDMPADILRIVGAYVTKYDIANIKAALVSLAVRKPPRLIAAGRMSNAGLLDELAGALEEEAVAEVLAQCGLHQYVPFVREHDIEGGLRARLQTEARLEAEYYRTLLETAARVQGNAVLTRALGTAIDIKNLQMALRTVIGGMTADISDRALDGGYIVSRQMVAELATLRLNELPGRFAGTQYQPAIEEIIGGYERANDVSVVDEVLEKHRFRLHREVLSPSVMSPLVAVWYIFVKEFEVRNLRLVYKATFDGLPLDEIRENLVVAS